MVALAGCGPAQVFHKDPERACPVAGELAIGGRDDVAAYAGCRELAGITIRTGALLDLSPLGRLEVVRGDLAIGPSVGLDEVSLPRLREITGELRVVANGNVHALFLPALERVARVEIDANNALANVSLPRLVHVGAVAITNQPELELIDVSALATVDDLAIADNPKLVVIEGQPRATRVRLERNPILPADVAAKLAPP